MVAIPTEIITEILQYVDFRTLRTSIPLVCRRFLAIIQDVSSQDAIGPLADAMFRFRRKHVPENVEHYELHPIFECLLVKATEAGEVGTAFTPGAFGFRSLSTGEFIPLSQSAFAFENATDPPCILFWWSVYGPDFNTEHVWVEAGDSEFVSVGELYQAIGTNSLWNFARSPRRYLSTDMKLFGNIGTRVHVELSNYIAIRSCIIEFNITDKNGLPPSTLGDHDDSEQSSRTPNGTVQQPSISGL